MDSWISIFQLFIINYVPAYFGTQIVPDDFVLFLGTKPFKVVSVSLWYAPIFFLKTPFMV